MPPLPPAAAPVDEKKPSMLAKSGHSMRGAPALNGVQAAMKCLGVTWLGWLDPPPHT